MARGYGTYSRFVAWSKILLPLLALVVLGTVFLFTSKNKIESGLSFSQADVASLESGSFIRNPQIDGQTTSGAPFFLTADEIKRQDNNEDLLNVTALTGIFHFSAADTVKISAQIAMVDVQAQTIMFSEGGEIETSDGNIAKVETLFVNLATGKISGTGIEADGPLGHISADDFRLEARDGENHVLWFENNVRMIYDL